MDKKLLEYRIHIAIIGTVSVGKSTLLNAILRDQYSSSSKAKTTMTPQIYQESIKVKSVDVNEIRSENDRINKIILEKATDKIKPLYYQVKRFSGISDKLEDDILLTIYDIPGICDSSSKEAFLGWLKDNFKLFDAVFFMSQSGTALNTMEEKELLYQTMQFAKIEQDKGKCIEIIPILNKSDSINYNGKILSFGTLEIGDIMDKYLGDITIPVNTDDEMVYDLDSDNNNPNLINSDDIDNVKIYSQANKIFHDGMDKYGLKENTVQNFIPISAELAYFLRTLDTQKVDVMTKASWFNANGKSLVNTYGKFYFTKKEWDKFNTPDQWKKLINFKRGLNVDKELINSGMVFLLEKIRDIIKNRESKFVLNKFMGDVIEIPSGQSNYDEYAEMLARKVENAKGLMERFKGINADDIMKKDCEAFKKHLERVIDGYKESYKKIGLPFVDNHIDVSSQRVDRFPKQNIYETSPYNLSTFHQNLLCAINTIEPGLLSNAPFVTNVTELFAQTVRHILIMVRKMVNSIRGIFSWYASAYSAKGYFNKFTSDFIIVNSFTCDLLSNDADINSRITKYIDYILNPKNIWLGSIFYDTNYDEELVSFTSIISHISGAYKPDSKFIKIIHLIHLKRRCSNAEKRKSLAILRKYGDKLKNASNISFLYRCSLQKCMMKEDISMEYIMTGVDEEVDISFESAIIEKHCI